MRSSAVLVLALAVVAGCGNGLAVNNYTTPFGTIRGTLAIPPGWQVGNLHIALVWLGFGGGAGQVAQAVSVEADSLTTFRIDVTTLPPPSTIWQTTDMSFSQGAIVAYDDVDGDGRLDVVAPPYESRDRVIGKSYDTRVFFLAEGNPDAVSTGFAPARRGLSLAHFDQQPPAPAGCAHDESGALVEDRCMFDLADPRTLDLPGGITVEVRDDPHLQGYACSNFWGSEDWPDWFSEWNRASPLEAQLCSGDGCDCIGVGCALDLPKPGVPVWCASDGTSYTYTTCVDDPRLCGTRFCHYGHGERHAGDASPAGWPCH
jgi:hypothetical protein